MKAILIVAAAVVIAASACTSNAETGANDRPSPETTPAAVPSTPGATAGKSPKHRRFDRLTMSLELRSNTVAPGGKIPSTVSIRNDSKRPVTDPGCAIYAFSYALVPADQPDAELWGQVIVDCSGPFVYKSGYIDRYAGPTFPATDKFGDPLPVGEYLAVMEIEYRSERFVEPVTVTE